MKLKQGVRNRYFKQQNATPPNNILNEVIKIGKDAMKGDLVNLFNRILDTGKYPSLWSFSLIVPIHKKDDRSKATSFKKSKITEVLLCFLR